jgi:hypothetical protein
VSLWLDHRERTGARGRTHALVIGVSHYRHPHCGIQSLSSPASSALDFAEWLRDRYYNPEAPLATVRLLLSPSQLERQAVPELGAHPPGFSPALRDEVEKALFAWREDCRNPANVAILFACGHGVQRSKEESSVLLEDFAANPNVMSFSLDVGQVHRGMAGEDLAQTQLYFVDACQDNPRSLRDVGWLGAGVGLPDPLYVADRRCAPIWFSAAPGTKALGQAGSGTLFTQALLRCLDSFAARSPTATRSHWHVTTTSLLEAMEQAVSEMAAEYDLRQTVVAGGLMRSAVFHVLASAPLVELSIYLEPAAAGPYALADLWDSSGAPIWRRERFTSNLLAGQIPAGIYTLDIDVDPATARFKPRERISLVVEPPRTLLVVRMTST